mmetsp:Transcript_15867/g.47644  ORF Transcript_15867/g.47644 Transcript_15867/m.47644 type:complete len:203 (+) Transcript_15867:4859-5467(+)
MEFYFFARSIETTVRPGIPLNLSGRLGSAVRRYANMSLATGKPHENGIRHMVRVLWGAKDRLLLSAHLDGAELSDWLVAFLGDDASLTRLGKTTASHQVKNIQTNFRLEGGRYHTYRGIGSKQSDLFRILTLIDFRGSNLHKEAGVLVPGQMGAEVDTDTTILVTHLIDIHAKVCKHGTNLCAAIVDPSRLCRRWLETHIVA